MSVATETPTSPIFSAEAQEDPNPVVARLRREDPVHWVPGFNFWLVTRHDDIRRLFHDPDSCTNDRRVHESYTPPQDSFMRWVADNGLFALDDTGHTRVRKFVSAAFTPRAVARMENQVVEVIEDFMPPSAVLREDLIRYMSLPFGRRPENLPVDFGS